MSRYKSRRAGYKQNRRKVNPYWNLLNKQVPKLENLKPLKYRENMTADEALALLNECKRLDELYASAGNCSSPIHDEESLAHFDRFVAGDR